MHLVVRQGEKTISSFYTNPVHKCFQTLHSLRLEDIKVIDLIKGPPGRRSVKSRKSHPKSINGSVLNGA